RVLQTDAQPLLDYADIGITVQTEGSEKKPILANFALYDVTRRAINALALISASKEESLTPDLIETFQDQLVERLSAKLSTETGKIDLQKSRDFLATETVKYLEAWHGYVRENYFTAGRIPNNSLEIIAYEGGHRMSA